jgi:dTDP-glucose 4,6-dehydratase
MRLLVTGGCGFLGSNFLRYVLQHYGPEMVTNVDALTTGRLVNVEGIAESYGERYEFLHADVAESEKLEALMAKHHFFAVVHFAAEGCSVAATRDLLDRARHHGIRRVLLVSSLDADGNLAEAEEQGLAAHRQFGQEVVIACATSSYGPCQAVTQWIPKIIVSALRELPAALGEDGAETHDWLHVEDLSAGLFAALLDGQPGKIYELRSGQEVRDADLAHQILNHLGKGRDLVRFEGRASQASTQRGGEHIAERPLAWKPRHQLDVALRETIDWYVRNREWWEPTLTD